MIVYLNLQNGLFEFTRTGPTDSPSTVQFSVAGTAVYPTHYTVEGEDTYTNSVGSIVIPIGQTSAILTANPIEANITDTKTIILTLTTVDGDLGSPFTATYSFIGEDPFSPLLSVCGDGPTFRNTYFFS